MDWKSITSLGSSVYFKTFILIVVVANVNSQYSKPPEQAILEKLFNDGRYDHRVRPINSGNTTQPVLVSVNFYLRRIDRVNDNDNEFSIQLTYRQKWRDDRLNFSSAGGTNHVSLLNPQNQIWRPDTFFSNEKEGNYHDIMSRNEFARIMSNGDLLQSARISLRLSCPMDFRKFPLDKQVCSMRLASYGYTTNDVKYEWEKDNPVQIANNLIVPKFVLEGVVTSYCDSITSTGSYSCLRVDFTLNRIFKPYLVHVYIPSTMVTIVSWLTFWLSVQAVTARVTFSTLALFTLSFQVFEVNKSFPPSGYTKAVDIWTGILLTFVFAALLETITVQYIARRNERKSANNGSKRNSQLLDTTEAAAADGNAGQEQDIPLKDIESPGDDAEKENQGAGQPSSSSPNVSQRLKNATRNYLSGFDSQPEKIDGVCRILFPILFVIFNIIYWSAYSA